MKIAIQAYGVASRIGAGVLKPGMTAGAALLLLAGCTTPAPMDDRPVTLVEVPARVETGPIAGDGSLAPAVWINRNNPSRSLVAAVGDGERMHVYSTDGKALASATPGQFDAIVTLGLARLGAERRVLFAATDSNRSRLALLAVNPETGEPDPAPFDIERLDFDPHGVCASQLVGGTAEVFVISDAGEIARFRLSVPRFGDANVRFAARRDFGTSVQACAADHVQKAVWFSQAGSGIWSVPLRMEGDATPERVARVGGVGLPFDPHGLAIVRSSGRAMIIASMPADDSFSAYAVTGGRSSGGVIRVAGDDPLEGRFRIIGSDGVDAASGSRYFDGGGASGIAGLPGGLLVVADQADDPGAGHNLKFVSLEELLDRF